MRARAEQVLAQLQALPEVSPYSLAVVHAGLGNREQVLHLLEQAVEERDVHVLDLGVDPVLREYRSEPRVQRLLQKMGLK